MKHKTVRLSKLKDAHLNFILERDNDGNSCEYWVWCDLRKPNQFWYITEHFIKRVGDFASDYGPDPVIICSIFRIEENEKIAFKHNIDDHFNYIDTGTHEYWNRVLTNLLTTRKFEKALKLC